MKKLLLLIFIGLGSCADKDDRIKEEFGKLSFSILPAKPRLDTAYMVALTCILRNHSNDTVYFMLSSCGGIDPYVKCDYDIFTPRIMYCNMSRFEPYALAPKAIYPFHFELFKRKPAKELRLWLDLNFTANKKIFPEGEKDGWVEVDSSSYIPCLWSNKINVERITSWK